MKTSCPHSHAALVSLFWFILFGLSACDKETENYVLTGTDLYRYIPEASQLPSGIFPICHSDPESGIYERLNIHEKDWSHHAQHGDVRLDDQDKDGFIAFNHCGVGAGTFVFDCDDQDGTRYPTNAEQCDGIDRDCNGDSVNRTTRIFDLSGRAYASGHALFGPTVGAVTARWVAMNAALSCQKFTGMEPVAGQIALIDQSVAEGMASCPQWEDNYYLRLALQVQEAGAVGVIFCQTKSASLIGAALGTKDPVVIPVSSLSQQDCIKLRAKGPRELSIRTRSLCGVPALPK
jgi:hypothetical protein